MSEDSSDIDGVNNALRWTQLSWYEALEVEYDRLPGNAYGFAPARTVKNMMHTVHTRIMCARGLNSMQKKRE